MRNSGYGRSTPGTVLCTSTAQTPGDTVLVRMSTDANWLTKCSLLYLDFRPDFSTTPDERDAN